MDQIQSIAVLLKAFGMTIGLALFVAVLSVMATAEYLKSYLQRHARQSFDKELEAHRQKLQLDADAIRLDYQRRLQDFSIYTRARHRAYVGIYRRLLFAEGALNGLWGFSFGRTWEDATIGEVKELLADRAIPGKTSSEILSIWDTDNKCAREKLDLALAEWKQSDASRKLTNLRNYQLMNELYCSPEIRTATEKCYQLFVKYWVQLRVPDRQDYEKIERLKAESQGSVVDLRCTMQRELQRGDYDRPSILGSRH